MGRWALVAAVAAAMMLSAALTTASSETGDAAPAAEGLEGLSPAAGEDGAAAAANTCTNAAAAGGTAGSCGPPSFRLADRMMLQDWFVQYAHMVDSRQFDRLPELFTDDAVLNYTSTAGVAGSVQEMSEWLTVAFTTYLGRTMHHISNVDVSFTGPTAATARAMLYNPVLIRGFRLTPFIMVGGWYIARFTREGPEAPWMCSKLDFDLAYNTASWSMLLVGTFTFAVVVAVCGRRWYTRRRGRSRASSSAGARGKRPRSQSNASSGGGRGRRRTGSNASDLLSPTGPLSSPPSTTPTPMAVS